MAETIRTQLDLLYRAGKVSFPARAQTLADAAEVIGAVHDSWSAPTVRAGSPPALVKAMEINESVHQLLRRAVLTWQDAAHALVFIADELVAADDSARDVANRQRFRLDDRAMPAMPVPAPLDRAEP